MLNILLIAELVLLLAVFCCFIRFWLEIRQLQHNIRMFFTPPGGDEPSEFAEVVNTVGKALGRSAAMEAKTTMMGKASGEARLETAIQGDMLNDTINHKSPVLGALLESFPTLKKRASKNPAVIEYLLNHLPSIIPGHGTSTPGNGSADTYSSRLSRFK